VVGKGGDRSARELFVEISGQRTLFELAY